MEKLSQELIDAALVEVQDWAQSGEAVQRTYRFDSFMGAIGFVNRIAELAEEVQHHPSMMIRYDKVTLTLSTHDAGGITEKDFDFARACDGTVAAT